MSLVMKHKGQKISAWLAHGGIAAVEHALGSGGGGAMTKMELKPISISKETSRRMAVMSFSCACMIVAIHCTPNPPLGSWQWWIANLLDFLLVLPAMLFVWRFLTGIHIPRWCAMNSFALYVMHLPFLLASIAIVAWLGIRSEMNSSIVIAIARLIFACAGSLMVACCLKSACPRFASLIFGGR